MGVERRSPHSRASHGTSGGKHLQYHDHELEIKLLEQDSIAEDTILSEEFLQLELRGGLLQVVS